MAKQPLKIGEWSLEWDLDEGGLIIENVKHSHFNLAHDIRVTRVWVDTEYPSKSDGKNLQNFKLNSSTLPLNGSEFGLLPSPGLSNPSSFFRGYRNLFGLTASFRSFTPYLAGTPNESSVALTQKYLFTDYGKNPAHEPTAVLEATRLFPLLSFSFPAVKDSSKPYPKYFRADYRLDVNLDNIDESALKAGSFTPGDTTTNKAGIFRDPESLKLDIFAANAPDNVSKLDTWDSVHIWPAKRGGETGEGGIATPGAFHAFHCHWRWGAFLGNPSTWVASKVGDPQFTGVGWSKAVGGALVDSSIPRQNLQFAITKNDAAEWKEGKNPSLKDFKSLFTSARALPNDVSGGDDLVFWLCFEVFRDEAKLGEVWGGTLFVNGFYFAHGKDRTGWSGKRAGVYKEGSRPSPSQKWDRLAR
jgi:hypothetical protein